MQKQNLDQIHIQRDLEDLQFFLRKARATDLATLPAALLEDALEMAKKREEKERKEREAFTKRTEKQRQKEAEAARHVEEAKSGIRDAEDNEELSDAAIEYESAYNEYRTAFNELHKVDPSAADRCFDSIPSADNPNERDRWLATMRKLWRH
jgi:hypothetical protein